jgi:hypothetical protein
MAEKNPNSWAKGEDQKSSSWTSWFLPMGLAFLASMLYRFYIAPQSQAR